MRRRPFWIILTLTTIAWLGVTMSEEYDYSEQLQLEWTGIDTARFATTYADSILPVTYKTTCFQAIKRHNQFRKEKFRIPIMGDTTLNVSQSLFEQIASQFNIINFTGVYSSKETIRYSVSQRMAKPFVPQLRDVQFHFAQQLGISGQPILDPDTVWLYGSPASLEKITNLYTAPAVIDHVSDSGYYAISLDPVWKVYPDLRASHDIVRLYIPVEHFAQTTITLPVHIQGNHAQDGIRLYPNQVEITLWVPLKQYDQLDTNDFQAVVDYDSRQPSTQLPVRIAQFPSNVRIKQIQPEKLEYVITKRNN